MRFRPVVARLAARVTMVVALVLAGLAISSAPAQASNFGSQCDPGTTNWCVSLGNNAYHVVNWEGDQDIAGMQASHAWARDNQYNVTDMVVYTDAADTLPDVRVWDEPYGDVGWAGRVECPANNTGTGGSHPSKWCRGQILRYNASEPDSFATEAYRRYVACHEMGHTVGLRHTTDNTSCLTTSWAAAPTVTNAHDRAHINATY